MKHYYKLGASLFLFSTSLFADSSIDLRAEYERWNTGINGSTHAMLYGFGGTHYLKDKLAVSGGLVTGNHSSPDDTFDKIKRMDANIGLGYQMHSKLVIFGGYRLISIKQNNSQDDERSFTDMTHGVGIGLSGFQPLSQKFLGYGRISVSGLLSTLQSDKTGKDRGTGFSTGLEVGITTQIKQKFVFGLSLKQQSYSIDYNNGDANWKNNYIRVGSSISRYF